MIAQLLYSGIDVGILHVEDFVKLVLDDGLKEATPHGFVKKLGKLISPGPDAAHRVENVVGASGHGTFHALLGTGTLYQVRVVVVGSGLRVVRRSPDHPLSLAFTCCPTVASCPLPCLLLFRIATCIRCGVVASIAIARVLAGCYGRWCCCIHSNHLHTADALLFANSRRSSCL